MENTHPYLRRSLGLVMLFVVALMPTGAWAQSTAVSGSVENPDGEAVIGASVVEQGTTNGTTTDARGNFTLQVSPQGKLNISFLGYETQNVSVNNRTRLNIILHPSATDLDAVVAVGYASMKRSDLTGAVSSISSDAIAKSVPTTIDQVLQGRAAGVQVEQNSGMPGAGASIRIRGINSLNSSNEPIYVIDGVVIDGGDNSNGNTDALANINPADIVSLDILKDASATAIYGSRAANGVIMITTRRGQAGEARVTYNGYVGWQMIPKKLDLLNLQEYAANRNVLAENNIVTPNNAFVHPELLGKGTDWQDELFQTAIMQSHNISLSGGSDKITYSLGAGYLNQDGIAAGSGFKRLNLNGSFDAQIKSWLKAGVNFSFANTTQKLTVSDQSLVSLAMRMTPDVPVRNADGTFGGSDEAFMPVNPMALAAMNTNKVEMADTRANGYLEATLYKGLNLRTELSMDISTDNNYLFDPTYYLSGTQHLDNNTGQNTKQYNKYWSWRNILTYDNTFSEVHHLTVMLGQEMSKTTSDYLLGSRNGFPSNLSTGLTLGDATTSFADGHDDMSSLVSGFGRVFYSYDDRYLITATLRRDGSSKFAKDQRWGWFPSTAFAWKISNESFLKGSQVLDNLKLRLGYGLVGNQNIPVNNAFIATYGSVPTPWGSGLLASNIPTPGLTWESTSSANIGVDVSLFKNRLQFVGDIYLKRTKNLLMEASLPGFAGTGGSLGTPGALGTPWVNMGSLQNKGIELTLNTVNVTHKDFQWTTNIVFSMNRNKVRSINTVSGQILGVANGNAWGVTESVPINRSVVGQPIGQFYGYQVIGRFEKATDFYYTGQDGQIHNTPVANNLPIDENTGVWIGDLIYKDRNGDGVITADDRTAIGNPEPDFTYGITNTFTWRDIDLTISLSGSYGNDIINYAERFMGDPHRGTSNLFRSALDYAQLGLIDPAMGDDYRNVRIIGGDKHAPRMAIGTNTADYNNMFSDRFVQDGSYLRIQNISLGYNLPKAWMHKIHIENLKIYLNIQNLYTFTNYKGYDPEIGSTYVNGNLLNGFDDGRYPSPRIYTLGLNITF